MAVWVKIFAIWICWAVFSVASYFVQTVEPHNKIYPIYSSAVVMLLATFLFLQ